MTDLVFNDVWVKVGATHLLSGISFTLQPGRLVALIGPNGAGKTTLLRTALGLVSTSNGTVSIGGQDPQTLSPRQRAAKLAWLPQAVNNTSALHAQDMVAAARYRFAESYLSSIKAAYQALDFVGAAALATRPVHQLSGGERQRVAMAALIAQKAQLLLLDEPANSLDPVHQIEMVHLIGRLVRQGLGVLVVTHDINLLTYANIDDCPLVIGLSRGQIAFEQPLDSPALPTSLEDLFHIPMQCFDNNGKRWIVARYEGSNEKRGARNEGQEKRG